MSTDGLEGFDPVISRLPLRRRPPPLRRPRRPFLSRPALYRRRPKTVQCRGVDAHLYERRRGNLSAESRADFGRIFLKSLIFSCFLLLFFEFFLTFPLIVYSLSQERNREGFTTFFACALLMHFFFHFRIFISRGKKIINKIIHLNEQRGICVQCFILGVLCRFSSPPPLLLSATAAFF